VRIHLGATVLQQVSEIGKHFIHSRGISGSYSAGGCDERFALSGGVLVEDENGKDVSEEKASGDQSDAPEDVQAARAHPFERGFETWPETRRKTAHGFRGREAGTVRHRSGNRWH
jgi:hypothetical protein